MVKPQSPDNNPLMFARSINVSTIEAPARREIHKQAAVQKQAAAEPSRMSRISTTHLVIGGNIVLAIAYGIFYGYSAGIFN